jgi:SAM-dependent MidA family methyltransferase
MDNVTALVAAAISNHQPLPFSQYMQLALYHPIYGYYNSLRLLEKRDFITATMISNLFAQALAQQILPIINQLPQANIVEFGAGTGKLATDLLHILGRDIDRYIIIECSSVLIKVQKETLNKVDQQHKVSWQTHLPDNFVGIVIANEVLDALAVDLVHFDDSGVAHSMGIIVTQNNKLQYKVYPSTDSTELELSMLALPHITNYQTEVHPICRKFIYNMIDCIQQGVVILLDYGYSQAQYYHYTRNTGTLRGFWQHQVLDHLQLLQYPADISSSVNWTLVAQSAKQAGGELIGFINQGNFLINCGILQALATAQAISTQATANALAAEVQYLLSPSMAESFQVMLLGKNMNIQDYQGIINRECSYRL